MRFTAALLTLSLALGFTTLGVTAAPTEVVDTVDTTEDAAEETENIDALRVVGYDLSRGNFFGAPRRPGQLGATPGWYFGKHPERHPKLPCLTGTICKVLSRYPKHLQCPRPPPSAPGGSTTITTTATVTTTATTTATSTVTPTGGSGTSTSSSSSPNPSLLPGLVGGYTPTFLNATGATEAGDYLTFGLVDTVADCQAMCDSVQKCAFVNTYNDINAKDGSTQLSCALFSLCHSVADSTNVGGQNQLGNGSLNYIMNSDGYCKDV